MIRRTFQLETNHMQSTSAKEIKGFDRKLLFEVMLFDRTNAMFYLQIERHITILSFNERN